MVKKKEKKDKGKIASAIDSLETNKAVADERREIITNALGGDTGIRVDENGNINIANVSSKDISRGVAEVLKKAILGRDLLIQPSAATKPTENPLRKLLWLLCLEMSLTGEELDQLVSECHTRSKASGNLSGYKATIKNALLGERSNGLTYKMFFQIVHDVLCADDMVLTLTGRDRRSGNRFSVKAKLGEK